MTICIDGPDNTGKDTQIALLQPFLIDKPLHILHYSNIKGIKGKSKQKKYSKKMYRDMFSFAEVFPDSHFIFNRSHIGENVYAPMYRGYSGSYIFKIEKEFVNADFWKDVHLITFYDEPDNIIKRDDGKSFSIEVDKKYEEIDRFIKTTERSRIPHKIIININNKSIEDVHKEIIKFLEL